MKSTLCIILFSCVSSLCQAQEQKENWFDFWVGEWDLSWTGTDGKMAKGKNKIEKILDGKVIQENFVNQASGFRGISVSTFNPAQNTWYQTWVDNQGGYIALTGRVDGDKKIFETGVMERDGKKSQSRMVFYNIAKDSFQWDWESTTDGGATWTLNWRIDYKRII